MKPVLPIEGQDGNIFAILGSASKAIKQSYYIREEANKVVSEMCNRVTNSKSYEEALSIIMEYVEFV